MAFCSNCGHQISEMAVACPNCGHPRGVASPSVQQLSRAAAYAGFWRRVVATLIDTVLVSVVGVAVAGERVTVNGFTTYQVDWLPSFGIWFLYTWLMLSFVRGQTLGKMALGIRICTPDGVPVEAGRAAARQGMAIVSTIALGLGFLWAAWDPERRTWHDSVANTRAFVIR